MPKVSCNKCFVLLTCVLVIVHIALHDEYDGHSDIHCQEYMLLRMPMQFICLDGSIHSVVMTVNNHSYSCQALLPDSNKLMPYKS